MYYIITVCKTYLGNDGIKRSYYDKFKTDEWDLLTDVRDILIMYYNLTEGFKWEIDIEEINFQYDSSLIFHLDGGEY